MLLRAGESNAMDFLHRNANGQPQAARANGASQAPTTASGNAGSDKFKKVFHGEPRWLRVVFLVLLFSLTVLAIAIAMLFYFGKSKEGEFVDKNKVQAVFLTNGQVYFGKIADVTGRYVDLQNIYYLNSQQQPAAGDQSTANQQTNFSLVKLGCELHGPIDQMVINRDQVSFWENLKSDGKVAKAIDQWVQQNPNGQNCESTANQQNTTQPNGTTNTENNSNQ
jgi:hypothetical protein